MDKKQRLSVELVEARQDYDAALEWHSQYLLRRELYRASLSKLGVGSAARPTESLVEENPWTQRELNRTKRKLQSIENELALVAAAEREKETKQKRSINHASLFAYALPQDS